MARGVQISLTLNPRDFIKGLKTIETDLEDVQDALDDLGDTDVDLDTDKVERGLEDVKDGLEDVEKAAGDAEDAFSDISSEAKSELGKVETAAQQAGAEVESELKDGAKDAEKAFSGLGAKAKAEMRTVENAADRAGDEVGEIEDEAAQSAKEFGASFRGDPVEALEEVQALASELANKLIPGIGGAVLSIAGGVAFGALVTFYEKWKEQQEARREQINEWRDTFLDAINETGAAIDREAILEGFKEQLDDAGVDVEDFFNAVDNLAPDLQRLWEKAFETGSAEDFRAAIEATERTNERYKSSVDGSTGGMQNFADAADTVAGATAGFDDELLQGITNAEIWDERIGGAAEETKTFEESVNDAADAVADFGGPFADADAAVDNFRETVNDTNAAVQELTENGAKPLKGGLEQTSEAGLDAKESLRGLAEDTLAAAAAQIELDGNTRNATVTTREGRQAFIEAAEQLGLTEQQASDYADQLGLIPKDVKSTVTVSDEGSVSATEDEIETLPGQVDTTVVVDDDGTVADTQGDIDDIEGTEADVDVSDEGTVRDVQRDIDGIDGRFVTIAVTDQGTVQAIQDRIDNLSGRTIYVNVVERSGARAQTGTQS